MRKNFPGRKEARREAAEKRLVARSKRSDEEQIELLKNRPGLSYKERNRLLDKLFADLEKE